MVGLEPRGHPEQGERIDGSLAHRAIAASLPAAAIQQDPLTVEAFEGAQAEIAVLEHIAHPHAAPVHALHQGAGGGHLIEGVVLQIQRRRQGLAHHMAGAFPGAAATLLKGRVQAIAKTDIEIMAGGGWGHGVMRRRRRYR